MSDEPDSDARTADPEVRRRTPSDLIDVNLATTRSTESDRTRGLGDHGVQSRGTRNRGLGDYKFHLLHYSGSGSKPPEISKKEWTNRAFKSAGIDPKKWRPNKGFEYNERNVIKVYTYYARLYLNDNKLLWAAMAKLAGREVYRGLTKELQPYIINNKINDMSPGLEYPPPGFEVALRGRYSEIIMNRLLQMQKEIFLDLGWQHEAYSKGGIFALSISLKRGELSSILFNAWQQIDSGEEREVQAGNIQLLYREQSKILPKHYEVIRDLPDANVIPWMMSGHTNSPMPGGLPFEKVVPGGDITKFSDRWKWIEKDMIPAFNNIEKDRLGKLVYSPLGVSSR